MSFVYQLARLPRRTGGVRYECEQEGAPTHTLYVEQEYLETLLANVECPVELEGGFPRFISIEIKAGE